MFIIPFLLSLIAGLTTLLGTLIIFINIKDTNRYISICLVFTAVIMIGISIFELIPSSFFYILKERNILITIIILITILIFSILLIKFINNLIKKEDNLYKIGILNMIVLMLHNFPEGIITFITSLHDIKLGFIIVLTIAFHNIPEGIAISSSIYASTKSRKKALLKTLISAIAEPIGAICAYIFLKNIINEYVISIILLVVGVLMLTLSIEKLVPEAISYNDKKGCKLGLILGLTVILISLFIL